MYIHLESIKVPDNYSLIVSTINSRVERIGTIKFRDEDIWKIESKMSEVKMFSLLKKRLKEYLVLECLKSKGLLEV